MPGEQQLDLNSAVAEIGEGLGFSSSGASNVHDTSNTGENDEQARPGQAGPSAPADERDGNAAPAGGDSQTLSKSGNAAAADDATGATSDGASDGKPRDPQSGDGTESSERRSADPNTPPQSWRAAPAALWKDLSPDVRAEIHRREEDFFRGIEQYKEAAAVGRDFHQVLQPFLPTLQQYGIDPYQQVAGLMRAHQTLALGSPQEKAAMLAQLDRDYNLNLRTMFTPAPSSEEAPYVDPEVLRLREQTESLQSTVAQITEGQRQQRATEINAQITKFAADPKNVYFKELANDMANLIRTGIAPTIEDAYQRAIWMNPTVRSKELTRQTAERAAADRTAAEEKAKKARQASAANLNKGAAGARPGASNATMDDTLMETLSAIRARDA